MSNNIDDDDMPPELEDLPEELIKSKKEAGNTANRYIGDITETRKEYEEDKVQEVKSKPEVKPVETVKKTSDSGLSGLKKGFLNSKPEPKPVQQQQSKPQQDQQKNDITTIKANPQAKDSKVLPEVQEAMKVNQTLIDKKDQWMTPEFLKKIAENPSLAKLFTNPEYMQAITMMQKNPKEVMEKYKNNKEFVELMTQFSMMMGQHFTDLGKKDQETQKQVAPTKETTSPENLALADKEVQDILNDKKVKSFLEYLQKNQKVDFHKVMMADPDLARKIKVLIDKKLIQLQSY